MSDRGENEALERVTREARGEPSPDLDWERIEQRLFERVDASEESAPERAGAWRIVAALAVAAVIALVAGAVLRGPEPTARTTPVPAARVFGAETPSPMNGAALHEGDSVATADREMVVDHQGRARWTLEANSRASMAELGEVIAVRLESGALSAKVVPSPKPETFVVEVSSARVAVHGTAFRVERKASGFAVVVTEGVVAVGPAGVRGDTQGWRLTPGDSGEFTLDGKSGTVSRAAAGAATAAIEPAPAEPPLEPGKPAVVANRPPRPAAPGAEEVTKSLDSIAGSAASCFTQHTTQGEVRVQVQTRVSVVFARDGRVEQVSFDPPLSPTITECVTSESKKLHVHESEQGATTSRLLLLGS